MAARSARRWTATVLRPARFLVTDDDIVVMASESGVLPIPGREDRAVAVLAANNAADRLNRAASSRTRKSSRSLNAEPYEEWLNRRSTTSRILMLSSQNWPSCRWKPPRCSIVSRAFGYTQEDICSRTDAVQWR
jgi:glutamate synthase (NADPH/NADH) large chain